MYRRCRVDKFFMGIQPSHFTMEEEKTSWLLLCRASHALKNQSVCFLVGSCGSTYLSGVTDGVGSGQGSERNKTWVGESSHQKNITRGLDSFCSLLFLSSQAIGRCGESDRKWE